MRNVLNMLVTVMVLLALALMVGSITGKFRIDSINSGSMAPVIPVGADVVVTPEPLSALQVGQVVAFVPPAPYSQVTVVHKVIQVKRALGVAVIRTRGVANNTKDPWQVVVRGQVWHVVTVVPVVGYITNFMRIGIIQVLTVIIVLSVLAAAAFAALARLRGDT